MPAGPRTSPEPGANGISTRLRGALQRVSALADALNPVFDEIETLEDPMRQIDRQLAALARSNLVATRLMTIPGVGVITATALLGSVGDIHAFHRARTSSAWLCLTPRKYSSGHTRRLGRISKRGDGYLRMLLTHGARSALLLAHRQARKGDATLTGLQRWVLDVELSHQSQRGDDRHGEQDRPNHLVRLDARGGLQGALSWITHTLPAATRVMSQPNSARGR